MIFHQPALRPYWVWAVQSAVPNVRTVRALRKGRMWLISTFWVATTSRIFGLSPGRSAS